LLRDITAYAIRIEQVERVEQTGLHLKARHAEVRIVITRVADGNALNGAHRRNYLLSDLLKRGACGGSIIINATSYGCATQRSNGTGSNHYRIRRAELERRVLDWNEQR
jgi:site-specific DNA recombinase